MRIININFRSVKGKKPDIADLISSLQPDIIIGTESHIDSSITDTQFLPPSYKAHHKDRNIHGGEVFIALKEEIFINCIRMEEYETNCEIIWLKLTTTDNKSFYLCAYYRLHVGDEESLQQFTLSIQKACSSDKRRVLIAGDLNFPGWDWSKNTLKPGAVHPRLHREFIELLEDNGLDQLVTEPTRGENTLDLVITNAPYLIPRLNVVPGLSDHDAVFFELKSKVIRNIKKPHKIYIYKNANCTAIKKDLNEISSNINEMSSQNKSTEDLWELF